MNAINNYVGQVGYDKLAAAYSSQMGSSGTSALKGSLETQEMVQKEISEMMRDVTPYLGQNIDMEA